MAILDDRLKQLNKKCDSNNTDITNTQIGLTETYQKSIKTDETVTDIQLALVELYEIILGGK